ncbi:hypothetical protein DPMN_094950 [Dreissena polymorpha]|uniref:Uncharacterized protein n=1 Tax=Dreissena polymorpha TaxID=45954 RepID=A0A9D4L5L4_DREPO|nr:hypothetical protein DPMN_094950 [Dreissena polymorpha]
MIHGVQIKNETIQTMVIVLQTFRGDRLVLFTMGLETPKYLSKEMTRRCAIEAVANV